MADIKSESAEDQKAVAAMPRNMGMLSICGAGLVGFGIFQLIVHKPVVEDPSKMPPEALPWLQQMGLTNPFAVGAWFIVMGLVAAVLGMCLRKRKFYWLAVLTALLWAIVFPIFGTIWGLYTLVQLCRPSVRAQFD